MTDTFHAAQPIYYQLAEKIKRQIIRGELKPGSKLPSVREMGVQSNVNPNTVQRTYRELEGMEIVYTKRGEGTFVTEDEHILTDMRERLKQEEISRFVQGMQEMGYTHQEIKNGLNTFLLKGRGEFRT